ncbi:helix-turn-helix transcriptional regulator [Micropruina sonneratiae]|uniref:helix-turn-helix transcriptional regulator n=1 Tax=Micropruina sonneratiae TaxID=2986940 RepID=UPI002226A632|nr:YafY family protein [Micropruina sp. KQZ13P-5]MCW3159095.1 YafY family transcriptional regulator [Micropruina sp. KQZ13P-5]
MSTDTTERALRVLGLLQSRPGWTASELAGDLGVTTRTVRRDIERLRQLGYAVEGERGVAGGYRLSRGRAVPPLLFTEDEAVAIGLGLQRTAALGEGAEAEDAVSALAKLDAALPAPLRERLRDLRDTVRHTGLPTRRSAPESLTRLAAAIRNRSRIGFGYPPTRSGRGDLARRWVEPYQLVASDNGWYLSGFDLDRDDWRLFRLDRLTDLAVSTFGYRPRSDAPDAVQRLGRIPAESYRHTAVVVIEAPIGPLSDWFGHYSNRLRALDERRTELRAGTDHPEHVPSWLTGLEAPYTVLGDVAVRDAFAAAGRRLLAAAASGIEPGES